ncbi:hypothetical protein FHR24_001124 [Wenyingzhuangia heitensis]|uniref:YceI-like domain-containing protein n=1 Tax=Wenyingzhuangia heitensis TaxID=1487859 RepID=A0ABX0U761_9FLAO|nr:hypothetical protein [Wenyingzhuangia heitensis]NIJ44685.1 hypothetical protein [Wenyingzhuangia heitensis]
MKILIVSLLFYSVSFCQSIPVDSSKIVSKQLQSINLNIKSNKNKQINDLEYLKKSLTNSPFIQGYKYNINLKQLETILPLQQLNNFIKNQNTSFFNSNLIQSSNTNVNLKGTVNVNGVTQVVTLKGILNDYNGHFTLQVSYRVGTNNIDYISKIVNEQYQNGLALKLKINFGK